MPACTSCRRPKAVLFLLILTTLLAGGCQRAPDPHAQLDAYLRRAAEVWGFQGAVLVASGDDLLLSAGYGDADRESGRGVTPDTKFMIGSLTKPFTAILILQLAAEGLLDLERPIGAYLPDYPSPLGQRVTLHHLLSHSSGIPDLLADPEFRARLAEPHTPDELIALFRDAPPRFAPGTDGAYANSNYVLLGEIAETVTGRPWEELIAERVCAPAGLTSTGVFPDYPDRLDFAIGYQPSPGGSPARAPYVHPSCGYAAGALASTVEDLYRLDRALRGGVLLSAEWVTAMETPHAAPYGYGWLLHEPGGHPLVAHGGGLPGFSSILQRWTEDSLCVAILSNQPGIPLHGIAQSLAAIVLAEPYEMPAAREALTLAPERLSEYVGRYAIAGGGERRLQVEVDELVARRDGGPPYRLLAESPDQFYFAHDPLTRIHFLRDDDGRISGHQLQQVFHEELAERIR